MQRAILHDFFRDIFKFFVKWPKIGCRELLKRGVVKRGGSFFGGLIRPNEAPKTTGGRTGHKNPSSNGLCGELGGVCEGVFVVIVQWVYSG